MQPLTPRAGLLLLALLLASASPAAAQGFDDDDDRPTRRGAATPAPTGFLVPTGDEEDDEFEDDDELDGEDEAPAPPAKRRTDEGPGREGADTRAWTEQAPRRGIQVIEETTRVPVDLKPEELREDRAGRPLGTGHGGGGLGLVPRRDADPRSFTFRANDEVPAVLEERAGRRPERATPGTPTRTGRTAPSGLLLPTEDDGFEETAPAPLPSQRGAMDEGSRVGLTPAGDLLGRPLDRGTGETIPVREIEVEPVGEITITPPTRERAPARRRPEPVREPAPEPVREPVHEPVATPRPEKPTPVAEPVRPAEPATTPPATPAAATAVDPFEKLERDLEAIEGPRAKPVAPEPAPARPAPVREAVVAEPPKPPESQHPEGVVGLGVGLGGGVLFAADSRGVVVPQFAYGAQVTWNPGFFPELGLDLSAFRTSAKGGTSAAAVDASSTHFGLRVLYMRTIAGPMFATLGAGALLTLNTARYVVDDGDPVETGASFARPGGDLTMGLGFRVRPLELRLDARVLVRGGLRLEFLPALSVGASF